MNTHRVKSINPSDPQALLKVIEALEVSEGIRGKPGDRKPTLDEVKKLILGKSNNSSTALGSTGTSLGGGAKPSKPTGLSVKALLDSIVISWAVANYQGHYGSEIYRATNNQLSDSVLIGSTSGNYFIDWSAEQGEEYYYFVRHKQDFSLGSKTGPYASSISGELVQPKTMPTVKAGLINSVSPKGISVGSVEAGRKVLISLKGTFFSTVDYDIANAVLLAEVGNAINVEIKRNNIAIKNISPQKIQTTHADTNGQTKYLYSLHVDVEDSPEAGELEYTLSAARIFPSDTNSFELSYSIRLI